MATDLAEFLGAALGFNLLFGIGLFPAAILTAIASFGILGLQRFGFRPLEATIAAMVGVIGLCYVIELFYANPPLLTVAKHAVLPEFQGTESILLAVGILGATVMPHVIYLHSSLTQSRIVPKTDAEAKKLLRYTRIDVIVAMTIAGLINMAMLVMAASTFFEKGLHDVGSIESAHKTLRAAARQRVRDDLRDRAHRLRASRAPRSARSPARSSCRASSSRQIPIWRPPPRHDGARVRRDRRSASTRRGRS